MAGKPSSDNDSKHWSNYFVQVHGFAMRNAFLASRTMLDVWGLYNLPIQMRRQRKGGCQWVKPTKHSTQNSSLLKRFP
jgi:hypothetical protein